MKNIYVIETLDDTFLGMIEFVPGGILVRDGFVGRPRFVDASDLISMSIVDDEDEMVESVIELDYIKVG